jgi:hypothetical protein
MRMRIRNPEAVKTEKVRNKRAGTVVQADMLDKIKNYIISGVYSRVSMVKPWIQSSIRGAVCPSA